MSKRPVNVELPEEVWKIIDNNLTKRRIKFGNTIKNHLAKNGYYPDADSLIHGKD